MVRGSVQGKGAARYKLEQGFFSLCVGASEAPTGELSVGRGHWVMEALISLVKCL